MAVLGYQAKDGAAATAGSLSAAQLLDRVIADLEASLSLRPDEALPLAKRRASGAERVSGEGGGAGQRKSEKKKRGSSNSATSKPRKGAIAAF